MVQLVSAGMVQILAFQVNLAGSQHFAQALAMVNGRGTALKFPADSAQLADKLCGMTDGLVRLVNLLKGCLLYTSIW